MFVCLRLPLLYEKITHFHTDRIIKPIFVHYLSDFLIHPPRYALIFWIFVLTNLVSMLQVLSIPLDLEQIYKNTHSQAAVQRDG